jgi:hypothetical protein
MHHLRRTITLIAGLAVCLLGVAAAAPSAFAARLITDDDAGTPTPAHPTAHSAPIGWELTLIALVVILAAVAVTVVVRRLRPHPTLHPTGR